MATLISPLQRCGSRWYWSPSTSCPSLVCVWVCVCLCVRPGVCVLPSWGLPGARFCASTLSIKVERKVSDQKLDLNFRQNEQLIASCGKWKVQIGRDNARLNHARSTSLQESHFWNLLETSEISRIAATTESKALRHVDAGDEPNPSRRSRNMMGYNQGYNKLFTQVSSGVNEPFVK
jgi:hypothetical protein